MTFNDAPFETEESSAESTVRIRHSWSESDRPSIAVIEAVAAATDRDPTAMSPLYDYVDPDALNAVVTPRETKTTNAITVSFAYEGVTVRIDNGGRIEVLSAGADRA